MRTLVLVLIAACQTPAPDVQAAPDVRPVIAVEPVVATPPTKPIEIAVASSLTCALTAGGDVWCWGENRFDPKSKEVCLSPWNNTDYPCHRLPTRVPIGRATHIAAGNDHACAILSDGGEVACWGYNMMGTLGDGTSEMHDHVTKVVGLRGITELALGSAHSCALDGQGRVWCWGANNYHALGDGTGEERTTPVRVPLDAPGTDEKQRRWLDAIHIAAGGMTSCAVLRDGTAMCWGDNGLDMVGDGTSMPRPTPVAVKNLRTVVEIRGGHQGMCARTTDGSAWCWGAGYISDPAHELKADRTAVPRKLPGLAHVTQLALGTAHACALIDHEVTCWGYDHPLGPLAAFTDIVQIGAQWNNTCVLHADGAIDCWGANWRGQLGDGTMDGTLQERTTPTRVKL